MTIHEQTTQAETIARQIELLNDTIAPIDFPTIETKRDLANEVLRLSRLIK